MGVIALIMAGGKGTRTHLPEEKPLIKVAGKVMIDRVIGAVRGAKKVDGIIVAVSDHTPKTIQRLKISKIKVVKTPGKGYIPDMRYAIKTCKLFTPVLVISADLPLITAKLIDDVIEFYEQCNKPALAVMVPTKLCRKLGFTPSYIFRFGGRRLAPTGVNIIDGQFIEKLRLREGILVTNRPELAVNVNSLRELELAEGLLKGGLHAGLCR